MARTNRDYKRPSDKGDRRNNPPRSTAPVTPRRPVNVREYEEEDSNE